MIELSVDVPAPVETVWKFLTETEHLRRWWNEGVSLDAVPGGIFIEPWTDVEGRRVVTSGKVLDIKEGREIRLSWADEDWAAATEVTFTLEDDGGKTRLTILHGGWQAFPEADRDPLIQAHRDGWRHHLDSLSAYARALVTEQ